LRCVACLSWRFSSPGFGRTHILGGPVFGGYVTLRPTFHKPSFMLKVPHGPETSILFITQEIQISVFLMTSHCPSSLTNKSNQPLPHKESQEFRTYCKARSRSALIPGSDKSIMSADFW